MSKYISSNIKPAIKFNSRVVNSHNLSQDIVMGNNISDLPFNPLTDIPGLQLYLAKNVATASSWLDQSINALNFTQANASKQPTIATKSVDFNGTNAFQQVVITDAFISDAYGTVFFSGYFDGTTQFFLTSANSTSNAYSIRFGINSDGRIFIQNQEGAKNDTITSTNQVTNGSYFSGFIKGIGASYIIHLNKVNETPIGVNDGTWFSGVTTRSNLALASVQRTSSLYSSPKINKIIYTNATLTTEQESDIEEFMNVPENY